MKTDSWVGSLGTKEERDFSQNLNWDEGHERLKELSLTRPGNRKTLISTCQDEECTVSCRENQTRDRGGKKESPEGLSIGK